MATCFAETITEEELKRLESQVAINRIKVARDRGLKFARIKYSNTKNFGKWDYMTNAQISLENTYKGFVEPVHFIDKVDENEIVVAYGTTSNMD